MSIDATLRESEKVSQDMLAAAGKEDWALLAELESLNRTLLARIDPANLSVNLHQTSLQRLFELNREVTRRVQNRRNDIAVLLKAFEDATTKADG